MKKTIIPFLAVALLASCSKNNPQNTDENSSQMKLYAGVVASVESKAPIGGGTGEQSSFTPSIVHWLCDGGISFSVTPSFPTTVTPLAYNATNQALSLNPVQSYDNAKTSYVQGVYPAVNAVAADGAATFTPALASDGSVDLMVTNRVSGTKASKIADALVFAHKLTQYRFEVKAGNDAMVGRIITGITLKSVQLPSGYNFNSETVSYAAAADLSAGVSGNPAIAAKALAVGAPVMVAPKEGSLLVKIVTNNAESTDEKTYETVTITPQAPATGFEAGKANKITLTFLSEDQVAVSATVTPWETVEYNQNVQ